MSSISMSSLGILLPVTFREVSISSAVCAFPIGSRAIGSAVTQFRLFVHIFWKAFLLVFDSFVRLCLETDDKIMLKTH